MNNQKIMSHLLQIPRFTAMRSLRIFTPLIAGLLILAPATTAFSYSLPSRVTPKAPSRNFSPSSSIFSHENDADIAGTNISSPKPIGQTEVGTVLNRSMFGIDVNAWDGQLHDNSTIQALKSVNMGIQQYPNEGSVVWNWETNTATNPNGSSYQEQTTLQQWKDVLLNTNMKGLLMVPYGFNGTGTGGETVHNVQLLTQYIVSHHYPVTAMVIGSEEYGSWAINLRKRQTPQRYAQVAAEMAQAIHAIDPSMQVGVDFNPPYNVFSVQPQVAEWNKVVLQTTAPYIQFVSYHAYPVTEVQSNSMLLRDMRAWISADMNYTHQQIDEYAGSYAPHIQTWITEFNPYNGISAQSVHSVFGAAAIEGMLDFIADGAGQVDWYNLHGIGAQPLPLGSPMSVTSLVNGVQAPYGVFSLTSTGVTPQPVPENALFPAGTAYQSLMQLIGQGSTMEVDSALYNNYRIFAAKITQQDGQSSWVLVNNRSVAQTLSVENQTVVVPSAGYKIVPNTLAVPGIPLDSIAAPATFPISGLLHNPSATTVPIVLTSPITRPQIPIVTSAIVNTNDNTVVITGNNLGSEPTMTPACMTGFDQTSLQVYDATNGAGYGWNGAETDCYGIQVDKWTSHEIKWTFATTPPHAGDSIVLKFWLLRGNQLIRVLQYPLTARP